MPTKSSPTGPPAALPVHAGLLVVRGVIGGLLMGLANLVPGISGGTMLLASGVYPRFILAVAEVSTLKFRRPSLLVLASVVGAAVVTIALLAGPVKTLVVDHRWVMYSLFIGLTLGGVPVVWSLAKPGSRGLWIGAAVGFAAMAVLAWAQQSGAGAGGEASGGWPLMFVAGVCGASAMILPGVSGGYLFLVLGVYVPILGAIHAFKEAAVARDWSAASEPAFGVVLPVAIGMVVGIVVVSNALEALLERCRKPTLGVLLGLLVGAVVGLWPFQRSVEPVVGQVIRGKAMTTELIAKLEPDKYPTEFFHPTFGQWMIALALVAVGFAATALLAKLSARFEAGR